MTSYYARTKAQRERTFNRFCKHLTYWAKSLATIHWKLEVTRAHGPEEVKEVSISGDPGYDGSVVNFEASYECANIILCTQDDTHWSDLSLEELAVHELVHIIWSGPSELISDKIAKSQAYRMHLEAATTRTARALMGAYANGSGLSRRPLLSSVR